jgi:hypothetical protein
MKRLISHKHALKPVILLALLQPGVALAQVPDTFREYITYGGFHSIHNVLSRIALSFSDNAYEGLFVAFLAVALTCWLAWGAYGFFRNGSWVGLIYMAFTILGGCIVYIALIRPTTSMVVYDELLNIHQEVAEVPEGVVLLAGMQNALTRTITDIIWTSAAPAVYDYRQNANGDVYNILRQVYNGEIDISATTGNGRYTNASLRRYCEDCVTFEILRPESDLNVNLFATSADLTALLEAAQNPAVFTVYFSDEFRTGTTVSCAEAYELIIADLNGITDISQENMNFWRTKCTEAGYHNSEGMVGQDQVGRCIERTIEFLSYITEGSVAPSEVTRNILIARELWNAAMNADIGTLGDFKIGTALTGEAISTDRWLPLIKEVMTAIYLGLVPFLVILLPTPLFGRVGGLILGFFCFLTAWEVCDALVHSYAMDHTVNFFDEIRRNGLSFKSIAMIENQSHRSMLMFGKTRAATMILAGVISGVIAKFGGAALAHFANTMNFAHLGSAAANQVLDPSQQVNALESYVKTPVPMETHLNQGYHEMVRLSGLAYAGNVAGSGQLLADSGGSLPAAATHKGLETTNRTLDGSARYGAINRQAGAHNIATQDARNVMQENQAASGLASARKAEELGMEEYYNRTSTEMTHRDAALRTLGAGGDLDEIQAQRGTIQGTQQRGDLDAHRDLGPEGIYQTAYADTARHSAHSIVAQVAAGDILQNGAVSPENRDLLNRMYDNPDLRGHVQTAARMDVSPDAAGASALSNYFGAHGHHFSPDMLQGSQVSFKMAYDPASDDVVPSNIDVSTGAGYHNIGQYFERPITPDNPYMLTNPSSGEEITLTSGRVYGQAGIYQQAEGFMADGTPLNLGSADGRHIDRMGVGERFSGFSSPYVLARLGLGIDDMMQGADLTNPSHRAEVIPQIAKAVSANFVSANQSYVDQLASTLGGSAGAGVGGKLGASGNIGVTWARQDVGRLTQNVITQRLMDVSTSATTNTGARAALQNEIQTMTGNNYRYMKDVIDEYSQNHIKDAARDTISRVQKGVGEFKKGFGEAQAHRKE